MSQTRHSVLSPTSSLIPGPNELEYLDIFDFFNYPRLHTKPDNLTHMADKPNMGDGHDIMNSHVMVDDRGNGMDGRTMSDMMAVAENFQPIKNGLFIRQDTTPDPSSDWLTISQTQHALGQ